jgi:hypothetical protein
MTTALENDPTVGTEQTAEQAGTTIFDKTLCLVLARGSMGTTKKAKGAAQTVAAHAVASTPEMIALNKKLFVAPEYKAIKSLDSEFRVSLERKALPSLLKGGTYSIPIPFIEGVDDEVRDYATKRAALVQILKVAWPRIVAEAETALGVQLFDPRNYPNADQLDRLFYVKHNWIDYGVPGRLKAIKASIWKDERAKAEADLRNAKDQAITDIRSRALDVVKHIVERLTPSEDGKKKVFRDSMLGNVKEFIELFPVLNTAAGDGALSPLVDKARKALDGVDPRLLRDDELVRQKVTEEFTAIQGVLDGMLTEQTRKIVFEDEGEGA